MFCVCDSGHIGCQTSAKVTKRGRKFERNVFVHAPVRLRHIRLHMSRWLLRSGERSPTASDGAGALKAPLRHGRRATEETVDGDVSRRSSQQSQADGVIEGAGATNTDPDSDWEVLHHTSALEGLCADTAAAAERPLSPGVDFTKGAIRKLETEASNGEGEDSCKWEDAANIHSFLVRGPTYLQVFFLRSQPMNIVDFVHTAVV